MGAHRLFRTSPMSLTIRLRHYTMPSENKGVPNEALGQSHVEVIFMLAFLYPSIYRAFMTVTCLNDQNALSL
jgi:hypothetical protein